jgi:hypothetical protein
MFGPPTEPTGYRYFGGWDDYESAWIKAFYGATDYFNRVVNYFLGQSTAAAPYVGVQNASIHNMLIPAVYGTYRLTSVPPAYALDKENYWNNTYIVAEGECSAISVNGSKVGDCTIKSENDTDPCQVWWGTTGQRKMYSIEKDEVVDSYSNLPKYVSVANGDGPSLSDLFVVWTKAKQTGTDSGKSGSTDYPTLNVLFTGKKVRTIQGWIDYLASGVDDVDQWTSAPDPIEVAVDYCTNGKFGPRLDIARIDLAQALIESAYCRALVARTDEGHETSTVSRFMFDGALTQDQSAEAQLSLILENCNGYYIPDGRKIVFGIRKAVDFGAVDALVSLSDTGTNRNILRENGKSTLTLEATDALDEYVNNMEVSFSDIANGYASNVVNCYDEEKQILSSRISNSDITRTVNSKQLSLIGTVNLDQAQRLGVLKLREEYLKRTKYTFKMSLKDSISLAPGDVRKLESALIDTGEASKSLASSEYVRIWKITETDKFTATVEACPHNNDYYENDVGVVIPFL